MGDKKEANSLKFQPFQMSRSHRSLRQSAKSKVMLVFKIPKAKEVVPCSGKWKIFRKEDLKTDFIRQKVLKRNSSDNQQPQIQKKTIDLPTQPNI